MKTKLTFSSLIAFTFLFFVETGLRAQCIDCGTGVDGAFLAASNSTLAGGTYNYSSFTINPGVTVSVTGNSPLIIFCTGNVSIQGTLTASGGNGGNGITFSTYGIGGVGVAGGANGGDGVYIGSPNPGSPGFGTGAGGGGAGWSGGGGGGSGGSIWLIVNTLNNMGAISAMGGVGGTTTIPGSPYWGDGAAGAAGRIRVDYFSITGGGTISPAVGYTEVPSTLSASATSTSASCHGACDGTVSATILTGTPPYTYAWSNGCNTQTCSGACAGTYTVTVTDFNGCTNMVTSVVTEPASVSVTASAGAPVCANACATLTANASGGNGAPFTYSWAPISVTGQSTVVCPGVTTTYTCVASDNLNCTGSATTTVNILPLPTLTLHAQLDTVCVNSTINILFGTPSGGSYFGTGVGGNNFNASIAGPGTHNVNYRYTGSNGCSDTITISIFAALCTGFEELTSGDAVVISPNPVRSELKVQSPKFKVERIEVYSLMGEKVLSYKPTSGIEKQFTINSSDMNEGIYFVKVSHGERVYAQKLVIE